MLHTWQAAGVIVLVMAFLPRPKLETGDATTLQPPKLRTTALDLEDCVNTTSWEVKKDVSKLIDFAIIGNPKTGTTFLADWLKTHPEIWMPTEEMRHMLVPFKGPAKSVNKLLPLYKEKGASDLIGYKCPADVRQLVALEHLRDFFPNTKLIVGALTMVLRRDVLSP